MKLKDSTFAIIAEKQGSISHKWIYGNPDIYWYWNKGCYYEYDKGKVRYFNPRANEYPDKDIPIYTEAEFEALLKAEQENECIQRKITDSEQVMKNAETLSQKQIESVISWMNTWEQLRDTAIPLRFKEDFKNKLKAEQENEAKEITQELMEKYNMLSGKPKELTEMPTWQKIVSGSDPKQITISYNLAIEYIAERLGVDKGIIKIESER